MLTVPNSVQTLSAYQRQTVKESLNPKEYLLPTNNTGGIRKLDN